MLSAMVWWLGGCLTTWIVMKVLRYEHFKTEKMMVFHNFLAIFIFSYYKDIIEGSKKFEETKSDLFLTQIQTKYDLIAKTISESMSVGHSLDSNLKFESWEDVLKYIENNNKQKIGVFHE